MRSERSPVPTWALRSAASSACWRSTSASYSRARRTRIALSRFCSWDFSSCIETTIPVGLWVMRTADSVGFTDCPPGPPRRLWGEAPPRVGRVPRLPPRPARPVDVDLQVAGIDVDVDLLGLGQHGDRRRGGVDAALGLGLGDALDAVRPALELEDRERAVALDRERVVAAVLVGLEHLVGEATPLGVAGEHPEEVAGEQPGLVAAGPLADLDDDVLVVVGVALHPREADLLLELGEARLGRGEHLAHLGVVPALGDQLARARDVVGRVAPLLGELGRRLELAVGAPEGGIALAVDDPRGIADPPRKPAEALLDLLDEGLDHDAASVSAEVYVSRFPGR